MIQWVPQEFRLDFLAKWPDVLKLTLETQILEKHPRLQSVLFAADRHPPINFAV